MPTVASVIKRTFRIMGVVDATETPEAEDFESAVEALNAMMRRWEANGLALGWDDVSVPGEALPAPDEAVEAIVLNLAIALRPEYGISLAPDVYGRADGGLAALRRDVKVASPMTWDRGGCAYNTRTDGYDC